MKNAFESELQKWMKNVLGPYCINECKDTCCKGEIHIDKSYEKLFKEFKLTEKKVLVVSKDSNVKEPYLYKGEYYSYFKGEFCPNYNPENKHCLIPNQHPMCTLFPLVERGEKRYMLSAACVLYNEYPETESLKSLILLCKKHDITLYTANKRGHTRDLTSEI